MVDVIIIGGGAAGLTAGIYSARKKLDTVVLEYERGGQTALQPEIWNYPGYTGVDGNKLMSIIREQAESFGAKIISFYVSEISTTKDENGDEYFVVRNEKGDEIMGKSVIIATGSKPRKLGIEGEQELSNKGVTYCATCDAPLFGGKDVVVVGAGNTGLDAAMQLTKYANRIYILVKDEVTGDTVTYEKLKSEPKVEFIYKANIKKILGEKFVESIIYEDESGKDVELKVSGVFVSIGTIPNSDFVKGFCELNQWGQIVIDPRTNATSRVGVFAAGDVTDILERQTIIAAGEGAKAALQCYKWLKSNR